MPGDNLNVNQGVQGGNFYNCDLQNPNFNINSLGGIYQKIRFIGKGSFGEAWIVKAKNVSDSTEFIMKEITCTEENIQIGKNEITMLKNCRHERIVCYIEDFYENSKIQIIIIFFCPKTTVLAEKLFHPADQRSAADSTLCMLHMLKLRLQNISRDISFFSIVSKEKLYRPAPKDSQFYVTFYNFLVVSSVLFVVSHLGTETLSCA